MSRAAIGLDDLPALKADIERISGASAERRLIRNGVGLILGLALVLVAWATVAQLGAAVMASGVVMGNHQVVQHPDGGVVSEILASPSCGLTRCRFAPCSTPSRRPSTPSPPWSRAWRPSRPARRPSSIPPA
jgi:hypothetical protein